LALLGFGNLSGSRGRRWRSTRATALVRGLRARRFDLLCAAWRWCSLSL